MAMFESMAASFQSFVSSTPPIDTLLPPMPTRNFSRLNNSCSDCASPDPSLPLCHPSEPVNPNKTFLAQGRDHVPPPLDIPKKPRTRKNGHIMRWDGCSRESTKWDSLRRDPELFERDAECAVHFYAEGKSQRGPSLMVSTDAIARAGCASMFETNHGKGSTCSPRITTSSRDSQSPPASPASDSGYSSNGSDDGIYNLYFPAPEHLPSEDSLSYHLATRNLFAWIMDKPLVGFSLGQAMIDLLERMLVVRPATEDSLDDCVAYAERMGYLYMTNEPDYALGMLAFAEHAGHEQIRNNAFVHCVGMNDHLYFRPDVVTIGARTQACIANEAMRMDIKIGKVVAALPNFFEVELDSSKLGLTPSQRAHLERFRSFLHTYHVSRYGYWPPPEFTRDILGDICFEFECLFELLVHRVKSSDSTTMLGGICVLQNINAFDKRHGFPPLDSNLVLLSPTAGLDGKSLMSKGFRGLLRSKASRKDLLARAQADLGAAVNKTIPRLKDCELVRSYLHFERDSIANLEPDLVIADARKVRWIQIYSALQLLKSITNTAATDIVPTEPPAYHTCCAVPPMPAHTATLRPSALQLHPTLRSPAPPTALIVPDCAADASYFAPTPFPQRKDSLSPRALRLSSRALRHRWHHSHHQPKHSPSSPYSPCSPSSYFALDVVDDDPHDLLAPAYPTSAVELEAALQLGPFELDATDNALEEPAVRTAMEFAARLRRAASVASLLLSGGDSEDRRRRGSTAGADSSGASEMSDASSVDTLATGPETPRMEEEGRVWVVGEEERGFEADGKHWDEDRVAVEWVDVVDRR